MIKMKREQKLEDKIGELADLKDPYVREALAERIIMQEWSRHLMYTAIAFLFVVVVSIIYFLCS